MESLIELKGNVNNTNCTQMQNVFVVVDTDELNLIALKNRSIECSSVSVIVSRMLIESKNGELLNRLRIKLGKTKEEIFELVSEL